MKVLVALLILASMALVGCSSKIVGETNTPPPAGGPPANSDHPPGLTDAEKKASEGK